MQIAHLSQSASQPARSQCQKQSGQMSCMPDTHCCTETPTHLLA